MAKIFEIIWSKTAVNDLDAILDYQAKRNGADSALDLYERIRHQITSLSQSPRRCRQVPELMELGLEEFRESILPPYRMFFRLTDGKVLLLGILDSRRDLEELLLQRAIRP